MAPSYYGAPRSTRDRAVYPPSIINRVLAGLPGGFRAQIQRLWDRQNYTSVTTQASRIPRPLRQFERRWHWKRLLSFPNIFILIWVLLLFWGERWAFQSAVKDCQWENWERWPKEATPHHLVFIADPQLIDPHSYPGRPKPLEALTILLTDTYMKRAYISLQKLLHPDTLFFLGDLFDGGREWKTAHGNTADPAWANGQRPSGEQALLKTWGKRYGEDFWLWEYERFGRIFYKYWNLGGDKAGPWQRNRRIISTLPGNHDLGFGANIKIPIRNRFEVYFGEGNRVDVIGNHTFVSVDSVSLSAGGSEHGTKEITEPVEEFLRNVQSTKRKAVAQELSLQAGEERTIQHKHGIEDLDNFDSKNLPSLDPGPGTNEFPTILLTHVPLYREPGTPCGPQRERHPPATPPKGQTTPVFPDHDNAISISRGYQYQNVLSEDDSVKLIKEIGNVQSVFSGDDHDYCEIIHSPTKNNVHEITVKSMSFAMGVRKPGFLMLSMWNPVGPDGKALFSSPSGHGSSSQQPVTTESHLCLLPDELGILIYYGVFIGITIVSLLVRAILTPILNLTHFSGPSAADIDLSILPTTNQDLKKSDNRDVDPDPSHSSTSSTSSNQNNLAPRSSAARTRSVSPSGGYGLPSTQIRFASPPLINSAGTRTYSPPYEDADTGRRRLPSAYDSGKSRRNNTSCLATVFREAWTSVFRVTWVVGCMWLWLIWFG